MSRQTLVLLSVSVGAGHVRAAEALRVTAKQQYNEIQAIHIDLMDIVPDHFRKLYADSYIHVIEHYPSLWGYLYRFADRIDPQRPLEPWLYRMTANLSYTWVKRSRRWLRPLEDFADWLVGSSKNPPDEMVEKRDDWNRVRRAVSKSKGKSRQAV